MRWPPTVFGSRGYGVGLTAFRVVTQYGKKATRPCHGGRAGGCRNSDHRGATRVALPVLYSRLSSSGSVSPEKSAILMAPNATTSDPRRLNAAREIFEHLAERLDTPFSVRLWDGSIVPLGRDADRARRSRPLHHDRRPGRAGFDFAAADAGDLAAPLRRRRHRFRGRRPAHLRRVGAPEEGQVQGARPAQGLPVETRPALVADTRGQGPPGPRLRRRRDRPPAQPFRVFDNREKHLLFVTATSEKQAIAGLLAAARPGKSAPTRRATTPYAGASVRRIHVP